MNKAVDSYLRRCYDTNRKKIEVACFKSRLSDAAGAEEDDTKGEDAESPNILRVRSWAYD